MRDSNIERGARRETIRTTNWASKLRLGTTLGTNLGTNPDADSEPLDDGCCADLDQDTKEHRSIDSQRYLFGIPTVGAAGQPTIGAEILGVVRVLMPRAESAGIRIRVEIDSSASGLTAGPIGTILHGMLRRAVDAYAAASANGVSFDDAPEITLCARLDGSLVRMHVLDGAKMRDVPSAESALGLAAATAESLGGTLEIGAVPFGYETILTATIPASRLANTNENAA